MENTERKGLLTRIQNYLDSPKGRILLNYLYSWGAAVVILGALFKLTHIKGANLMLFIGMGTEVLVFFISGFERPYIPEQDNDDSDMADTPRVHGNIYINGAVSAAPAGIQQQPVAAQPAAVSAGSPLDTSGMEQVTQDYVTRIQDLTARMESMCRHSERMEQSSEEIEQLSRNLISINTFYQMHLKSASSQMENIEKVNEQTQLMVEKIEELNRVYARMVEAMKVNSQMGAN